MGLLDVISRAATPCQTAESAVRMGRAFAVLGLVDMMFGIVVDQNKQVCS
jgi:hypothetical protein